MQITPWLIRNSSESTINLDSKKPSLRRLQLQCHCHASIKIGVSHPYISLRENLGLLYDKYRTQHASTH
jgi:hypothetical protein